jgi:non-specific serine/threonine protein kinase/serine/threonine-protein kinase
MDDRASLAASGNLEARAAVTTDRWLRTKDILAEAFTLPPSERASYVEQVCAADVDLYAEVHALLASHEAASIGFLETPVATLRPSAATATATLSRVGHSIGPYAIVGELGRGGMGEVYRAVRADGQFTKEVALKLVKSGIDSHFIVERFRNERQILAGLDHPNIARLYDGGTTADGVPYLVMELVAGVPIDAYCDDKRLPIADRLRLFVQVCSAVQYAHQRLVVHRDLKPNNILVSEGVPKLLDFGIAKLVDGSATAEVTLARPMTVEYASPEQIQSGPITTATDIYSLGVVLYRLLTGRSPYRVTSPSQLSRAIVEEQPERPSAVTVPSLRRRLTGDLDNILMMALRKEPQRRYASVEAFVDDIRRYLESRPVRARKDSWGYRSRRFAARHRIGVAASAAAIILLAAGSAALIREWRLARRQAAVADAERRRAERRFDDVRQLSNSLIFEIHDAIENLPGATPARKLLLDRAVAYLDRLSSDSSGDVALQRELAWGYQRLAVVQGSPTESNLGDPDAAESSNRKATALFEAVARANPADVIDQLNVAMGHRLLAFAGIARGTGRGDLDQAMAITDRLLRIDGSNLKVKSERSVEYQNLALMQDASGDRAAALDSFEKNLALKREMLAAAYPDMPRRMAMATALVGDELTRVGRIADALQVQQTAQQWYDQATAVQDLGSLRERAVARLMLADTQLMLGQRAASAETVERARATLTAMATSDPENVMLRVDVAGTEYRVGRALALDGRYAEAIDALNRAVDGFERAGTRSQPAGDIALDESAALIWLGDVYVRVGQTSTSLAKYRAATSMLEAARWDAPLNQDGLCTLATAMNRVGEVLMKTGDLAGAAAAFQHARGIVDGDVALARHDIPSLYSAAETLAGLSAVAAAEARTAGTMAASATLRTRARDLYANSQTLRNALRTHGPVTPIGLAASPLANSPPR